MTTVSSAPSSGASSSARLRARAESASAHLPGLVLSAERLVSMVAPGAHGLRRAGPGEDFWQYRPAAQGDTARAIDWRRSGRSDAQFVRDREAQTAQSLALWVSAGQGMGYSSGAERPAKADRARLLALALAMLSLRGGEKVGLLGGPSRAGRMQPLHMAEAMLAAAPAAGDDDLPDADMLRPGQRLVLIGDYLERPEWLAPFLARASAMGLRGVLLQVLDPAEEDFPFSGAVLFRSLSGATDHDSRDAAGLRAAYLQRLAERRDWLVAQGAGAGWHFGHHRTDHAPALALQWLYQVLGG